MKNKSKNMFLFFLSILIATGMLASMSLAEIPYWDTSWSYRKQLAITNTVGTTLYDYSMKITLDTASLISQGKMQSDCGDIRIIENGAEINYGIKNPNSASTEIYFIANDLIVGDNNDVYIYYGNPEADNGFLENWKDAFYIWYDDFDTDRGWYDVWGRGGYYTVADGHLTIYFSPYIDGAYAPSDASSFPMNGRVGIKTETKMMVLNNRICQGQISLSWGYPIGNISGGHNRYALAFSELISKPINPNTWYTSETIYNRLTGDWYGNFDGEVTTGNRPALESDDFSTIMVAGCNSNDPRVDYIYLRYFIEPEPSYSLGQEEQALWELEATLDLVPDVFEIKLGKPKKPKEPKEQFIRAFIELPADVNAVDVDVNTVTLSLNDTTLAAAEKLLIVDNILDVLFPLDPNNVGTILGLEVTKVKVTREKIKVGANEAPPQPIDLIELTVSGDVIDGGSLTSSDAVRVIIKKHKEHDDEDDDRRPRRGRWRDDEDD